MPVSTEEQTHAASSCQCGGSSKSHGCGCGGHHSHGGVSCGCGGRHDQAASTHSHEHGHGGCGCQGLRKYRRIHSVAGAIFGLFIVCHLAFAATAVSPELFNRNSAALHDWSDRVPVIQWIAVLLPLVVLVGVGVYLLAKAGLRYNTRICTRSGRMCYFLQRLTAAIMLLFLLMHLSAFGPLAIRQTYSNDAPMTSVQAGVRTYLASLPAGNLLNVMIAGLYLVGVLAVSYHLANGLWTGASVWKLLTSPLRKRIWGTACVCVGVVTTACGSIAWTALVVVH